MRPTAGALIVSTLGLMVACGPPRLEPVAVVASGGDLDGRRGSVASADLAGPRAPGDAASSSSGSLAPVPVGPSSGSSGGAPPGNSIGGTTSVDVQVAQEYGGEIAEGLLLADGGYAPNYFRAAFLSDDPSATICGEGRFSATTLQVIATRVGGPVTPGHYVGQLGAPQYAFFSFTHALPGGGAESTTASGDSDFTIDVTEADDAGFAGTYRGSDFPDGGPFFLSGTFAVSPCPE